MTKRIIAIHIAIGLLLTFTPVWAMPSAPGLDVAVLSIPAHAVQVTPDIFSLGTAVDPESGKVVEGFAIVHPKKGYHHRPGHGGGPGGGDNPGNTSSCFSFLAKDAKWKADEAWIVNTANIRGLSSDFVFNNLAADIAKWEGAASADIFGDGSTTLDTLVADTVSPDGANEVYFADVSSSGAIAVTIVWGIFGGPPFARELVEWDMVFDDVDFDWSSTGEVGKMDFENITTHELGHAAGMGHPEDACSEETMYRFASFGETKKRTLEAGDIAGIAKLY